MLEWPNGDEVVQNSKVPAGSTIGETKYFYAAGMVGVGVVKGRKVLKEWKLSEHLFKLLDFHLREIPCISICSTFKMYSQIMNS